MVYASNERRWGVRLALKESVHQILKHCRSMPGGGHKLSDKEITRICKDCADATKLYLAYRLVYDANEGGNKEELEAAKKDLVEVHEEFGFNSIKDVWVSYPRPRLIQLS